MNTSDTMADTAPSFAVERTGTDADRHAIRALLRAYTDSVETCDRQRFETLLLSTDIPFFGVAAGSSAAGESADLVVRNYPSFRNGVFESGNHYRQRFYNETIELDGSLASVTLDFVTTVVEAARQICGWKVLHLLKVQGQWKIASEFYTRHPMDAAARA